MPSGLTNVPTLTTRIGAPQRGHEVREKRGFVSKYLSWTRKPHPPLFVALHMTSKAALPARYLHRQTTKLQLAHFCRRGDGARRAIIFFRRLV